jgi:hypothetical protein
VGPRGQGQSAGHGPLGTAVHHCMLVSCVLCALHLASGAGVGGGVGGGGWRVAAGQRRCSVCDLEFGICLVELVQFIKFIVCTRKVIFQRPLEKTWLRSDGRWG